MIIVKYNTVIPALFGALLFVLIWLKFEKEKRDKNPDYAESNTWLQYFGKSWDDFLFAFVCAAVLGQYQNEIAGMIQVWRKYDESIYWNNYNDWERWIGFLAGLFGTSIVKGLYEGGLILIRAIFAKLKFLKTKK